MGRVVREFAAHRPREIVVVDNGSRDGTAGAARTAGATVLSEPRHGYGRACLAGLAYLRRHPPEVVVFVDADASDDPADLPAILQPLRLGRADLVIGSRALGRAEPGSMTVPQRFGNRFATWLIARCTGHAFTDLGPFRAIRWSRFFQLVD